eukprot:351801-Chlamydomonas_euryale.AAC.6
MPFPCGRKVIDGVDQCARLHAVEGQDITNSGCRIRARNEYVKRQMLFSRSQRCEAPSATYGCPFPSRVLRAIAPLEISGPVSSSKLKPIALTLRRALLDLECALATNGMRNAAVRWTPTSDGEAAFAP